MYKYKAMPPEETVCHIQRILDTIGIKTAVKQYKYNNYLYSCRVIITNGKLEEYNIGCNGKGVTREYALASGYAELMERIQNHVLGYEGQKYSVDLFHRQQLFKKLPFQEKVGCPLNYFLYPDENVVMEDFMKVKNLLGSVCPAVVGFEFPEKISDKKFCVIYADMYNLTRKKVSNMPIELMRYLSDSTGMCSGNNPAEAILQGICEICERYILQQIYLRKVRFPLFDTSCLSEKTKVLLASIESKGYDTKIINCSLEGKFPVIGLLVENNTERTYTFRLGSDINPDVALTRCITEIFQGIDCNEEISWWEDRKDFFALYEYHKSLVNGTGLVPLDTFMFDQHSNCYLENIDDTSRKGALLDFIEHFKKSGIEFWVRDNSYLSFPSYYVYSPQLSPVSNYLRPQIPFILYQICTENYFNINPKYHICDELSEMETDHLCSFLSVNYGKELLLHPYSLKKEGNRFNVFLLLMAFKLSRKLYADVIDMVETAHSFLYMDDKYYNTLKTALKLAIGGCSKHTIQSAIKELDDIVCVSDIVADLYIRNHALSGYEDFNLCNLFVEDSVYSDWIEIQSKISASFYAKKINQSVIMDSILQSD